MYVPFFFFFKLYIIVLVLPNIKIGFRMGNTCIPVADSFSCALFYREKNGHQVKLSSASLLIPAVCMLSSFSRVGLFATPWTVAHQAPLSVRILQTRICSGLPFPSPGDLPNPGIKSMTSALKVNSVSSQPSTLGISD